MRIVQQVRAERAECPAHDEQGREHTAGRAGAERDPPDHRLHEQQPEEKPAHQPAVEQIVDDVVPHAQRAGLEQAPYAHEYAADGGPPHPVDREPGERIFHPV